MGYAVVFSFRNVNKEITKFATCRCHDNSSVNTDLIQQDRTVTALRCQIPDAAIGQLQIHLLGIGQHRQFNIRTHRKIRSGDQIKNRCFHNILHQHHIVGLHGQIAVMQVKGKDGCTHAHIVNTGETHRLQHAGQHFFPFGRACQGVVGGYCRIRQGQALIKPMAAGKLTESGRGGLLRQCLHAIGQLSGSKLEHRTVLRILLRINAIINI